MESLLADSEIQDVLNRKFAFVKVDLGRWDQNPALKAEYEIRAITTLVVADAKGNIIEKKILEPVTNPEKTCGHMNKEKLLEYLLKL